ncbi:ubiquilin-1 [Drosophila hydei]|uniref:Ubiquilin-1 n=1 Tax=Drosophila hydei TaxID=7224 RepID=A0A6J1MGS0_DROHY|nr:ubiquilin-1 [Drosophila hydei]
MCCKTIDITAKTGSSSALISVRQNELISNLRVLVAVRFEQAIDFVVLVFGGQVLRDEGTIDSHGIISGVTVHVVFRQLTKETPDDHDCNNANSRNDSCSSNKSSSFSASSAAMSSSSPTTARNWVLKSGDIFKPLLEDPCTLRDMLQSDVRIRTMIDENASFRHFLSSDRNLRELFSTIFNPAKVQELGRKRDMHIMRMEWVPGGYSLLGKLNCFMRQAHEDNVAMNYLDADTCSCTDNPQRGRENRMPLPNPWRIQPKPETLQSFALNAERMVADLTQKCDHMMQSLKLGDFNKTLEHARQLNELADNARRQLDNRVRKRFLSAEQAAAQAASTATGGTAATTAPSNVSSLNLFDFMSSNDSRWEQRFHSQLLQLSTLGHTDRQRNICALLMSAGDIQTAVRLLEQWNR